MRILTSESMAAVDRRAIEEMGMPSLVLMENAARGVVDAITETFPDADSAVVVCGPGNNGGDGLAVARLLALRSWEVDVVLVSGGKEPSPDAEAQRRLCDAMDLRTDEFASTTDLDGPSSFGRSHDLVVDGLFGTGLSRPLEGLFAAAVERIGASGCPVVAIDLPSGLDASRAEPIGPHVRADLTVALAAHKIAHVFPPAATAVGEVRVADLGMPPSLLRQAEGDLHILAAEELRALLVPRALASHKGDFGHVLIVAGSPGKAGAAILAARAAVRAGAGLVTVAVPESIAETVDGASVESMTSALPCGESGRLTEASVAAVLAECDGRSAVALGPGLGVEGETGAAIRDIVVDCPLPLVLDADGVNAFAGRPEALSRRRVGTALTPHPGELARLMGWTKERIVGDRLRAVRAAATATDGVVALKGHQTLVASADQRVAVNPTGNPGMATGGTGDVLTGVAAAFSARGLGLAESLELAVFVHGLAGDLAVDVRGEEGLAADDLVAWLPAALLELTG